MNTRELLGVRRFMALALELVARALRQPESLVLAAVFVVLILRSNPLEPEGLPLGWVVEFGAHRQQELAC